VDGTADVFDGIVVAGPMLRIVPNEAKLKQFGLTASDLQQQVQTYLEGTVVGSIPEKEQLTNVRMIYPLNNKTPIEKIEQVQICTPTGSYFPLSRFAKVKMESGVAEIERENLQTIGAVTARLSGRDLGSVMKDVQRKLGQINLPPSYQIEYGGSYAEQQKSFDELLKILIAGGLLVFTVVLFMFKDIKLSYVVIVLSLLGISGSILALYLLGVPLNVGSYTGLIMIIGIIGENSIFTIQQFFDERKRSDVDKALVHAIAARLRPKLMTVIGAIIALTPLALGIGTGAQMHQPLAIAVIGGLVMALPLLLVILPSILRVIYSGKE
jgi:multidrug efflux pump subunit AcrB